MRVGKTFKAENLGFFQQSCALTQSQSSQNEKETHQLGHQYEADLGR